MQNRINVPQGLTTARAECFITPFSSRRSVFIGFTLFSMIFIALFTCPKSQAAAKQQNAASPFSQWLDPASDSKIVSFSPKMAVNFAKIVQTKLDKLYQRAQLMPSASDSYFPNSDFYQMAAVPFMALPSAGGAVRFEIIAQRFNRGRYQLTNLPAETMAHDISCLNNDNTNYNDHAFALGVSWQPKANMTLNSLISTAAVPGYADQQMVLGLQITF